MRGIDPRTLIAHSDLDPEAILAGGDGWISRSAYYETLERAARATGDPTLGLHIPASMPFIALAASTVPMDFVLAQLLTTSATVRDAVETVSWAYPLTYADARLSLERTTDGVTVRFVPPDSPGSRIATDFAMSWIVCALRATCSRPFTPAAARFRHAAPSDERAYRELFGDHLTFASSDDALDVPSELADAPLLSANAPLHTIVRQRAARMLEICDQGRFAEIVRNLIVEELPTGNPTAALIARRLNVSMRTLTRRLATEGLTYLSLLDQVRSGLAERYLLERLPTAEIARLVGFADPTAFNRAFRRWHDCSPRAWRDRIR